MNRILAATAVAIALASAASVYAASAPAPASTIGASSATPVDDAARCTSLAKRWKTAEAANAANPNLERAKSRATMADMFCKSPNPRKWRKGAQDYEAALRRLERHK